MKYADALYTYVPKNNTLDTDGLYGPWGDSEEHLVKRYGRRAQSDTKQGVLDWLESIDPGRSHSLSVLTEPIPPTADQRFLDFANKNQLVKLPSVQVLLAAGLIHPEFYKSNGGKKLYKRKRVSYKPIDWNQNEDGLLFKHIPHYMLIADNPIPPEYLEKQARLLYHGSPYDISVSSGSATKASHNADGRAFLTPDKVLAACFIINKQKILDKLEKQLGHRIENSNFSYDVWKMSPEERASKDRITVGINVPGIKPFNGSATGYIYSADVPDDKLKQYTDSDMNKEVVVEGDVPYQDQEKQRVRYRVQSSV